MWSGLGWAEPSAAVPRGGRAEPSREEARAAPGATRSRWAPAAGHPARVPLCAVPGWTRARALPRGRGPLLLPRSALGPPVPPPPPRATRAGRSAGEVASLRGTRKLCVLGVGFRGRVRGARRPRGRKGSACPRAGRGFIVAETVPASGERGAHPDPARSRAAHRRPRCPGSTPAPGCERVAGGLLGPGTANDARPRAKMPCGSVGPRFTERGLWPGPRRRAAGEGTPDQLGSVRGPMQSGNAGSLAQQSPRT